MPYKSVSELPQEQVDQYSAHQKHAFLKAFNNALKEYGDESRAFAVAHTAAKRAPKDRSRRERLAADHTSTIPFAAGRRLLRRARKTSRLWVGNATRRVGAASARAARLCRV
jgi:cation transport regulator